MTTSSYQLLSAAPWWQRYQASKLPAVGPPNPSFFTMLLLAKSDRLRSPEFSPRHRLTTSKGGELLCLGGLCENTGNTQNVFGGPCALLPARRMPVSMNP